MIVEPPVKKATPVVLLGHWYILVEKLQASPKEFYSRVEQALAERQVPELEVMTVDRHEGGPMSAKRLYLRLVRQRMVFDICGAPFGTGFFVSWRLGELPLSINPLSVLILLNHRARVRAA